MSDLIKPTKENLNSIKTFFKERYEVLLNEEEAKEVYLSLFFLGKALHRYKRLNKGVAND